MSEATPDVRTGGEFERYGLLAAVTLVVLCMLMADRYRSAPRAAVAPPPDKLLRVRIGGFDSTPRVAAVTPTPQPTPVARGGQGTAARPIAGGGVTAPSKPTPDRTPPAPVTARVPTAARTCVIAGGETLGDIAQRELGSAKRAREIADLNGIADLHKVREGQTLRLPPR